MNIPKGRILVKDILPTRNGIILTDRPEYKRGVVVIGSKNVDIGEYVAFKANGDVVDFNGEKHRLIKDSVVILRGDKDMIMNAKMKDVFCYTEKAKINTITRN
jgi:hypothetical protein